MVTPFQILLHVKLEAFLLLTTRGDDGQASTGKITGVIWYHWEQPPGGPCGRCTSLLGERGYMYIHIRAHTRIMYVHKHAYRHMHVSCVYTHIDTYMCVMYVHTYYHSDFPLTVFDFI